MRNSWPLLLLLAVPARAAFQSEFTGVRAASLGGAVAARGEGAADLFATPVGLASLGGAEVSFMYGKPFSGLDGVDMGQGSAALGLPSRWGNWGLGAASFRAAGAKEERTLAASYALGLPGGGASLGVTVKHMSHQYLIGGDAGAQSDPLFQNGARKSAVDLDLGVSARVGGPLRAGVTVRNARGADVGLAGEDRLRREVQAGLALDLSDWGVKASGDLSFASRGPSDENRMQPSFGLEKTLYKDVFALRGGANRDRFAAGLGVRYRSLSLDYALLFNRALSGNDGSSHQVQTTWRFSTVSK